MKTTDDQTVESGMPAADARSSLTGHIGWLAVFILVAGWGHVAFSASSAPESASLRFSHRSHHQHRVTCATCHPVVPAIPAPRVELPAGWQPLVPSRIIHPDKAAANSSGNIGEEPPAISQTFARPPEEVCLRCHFKQRAKSDCGLCHLDRPAPTQRRRHRILPAAQFPHDRHMKEDCLHCHPHITDWETLDGKMQDTSMAGCLKCHNGVKTSKTCTLCHNPTPRPRDHVRNFSAKHGIPYRADPHRCRMCHEDSSCVACHSRRPRNHTLAWVARRHGISARTQPDNCRACHESKSVCRRCHPNF